MNFEESISNINERDSIIQVHLAAKYDLRTPILCKHCLRYVIYEHRNEDSICDGLCILATGSEPKRAEGVWSTDAACNLFLPGHVKPREEKRTCSNCKAGVKYRRGFKGASALTYRCTNEKSGHRNIPGAYSCPFHVKKKGKK